jgi:uncharacterized integral membrane protein
MLSKTHDTPDGSPAPGVGPDTSGVIPDTSTTPVGDESVGSPVVTDTDADSARVSAATATPTETRTQRFRRKAHRGRLHGYAIAGVALVAYVVALGASNTAQVKVSWAFGSSHVSLVWLVLFASVLGWLLGLLTGARLHWRTRAPRGGGARS